MRRYKNVQIALDATRESKPSAMLVDILAKERVGVVPTLGMENMARVASANEAELAKAAAAA